MPFLNGRLKSHFPIGRSLQKNSPSYPKKKKKKMNNNTTWPPLGCRVSQSQQPSGDDEDSRGRHTASDISQNLHAVWCVPARLTSVVKRARARSVVNLLRVSGTGAACDFHSLHKRSKMTGQAADDRCVRGPCPNRTACHERSHVPA